MPEVAEPELTRPGQYVRDYVLPLSPSGFEQSADVSEKNVEVMRAILAQQYVEHTNLGPLWKTTLILLVYDLGFQLNSVVYGLLLGALGSIALALSDFYTPELLAEEAFRESGYRLSDIEAKAERTVKTNVGVAGLAIGFVWQIFTISGPIPSELVTQNYLYGIMSSWLGFVISFFGVLLLISIISKLRDYFSE